MKQLNITQWLYEQRELNKGLYAIVDPRSPHQPLVAFYQCGGEDGGPLMSLDTLTNPQDGPWLLPVNAQFIEWWQQDDHAQSGIIVSTDSVQKELRAHFASLFQAMLLGERVFFSFYNPAYIGAMLPRLLPEEVSQLLRNHSVLIRYNQQWQSWQADVPTQQTLAQDQNTPWWIIKEHHIDNTANVPLLSRNVESWLWQNQSQLMETRIDHNMPHFDSAFQAHFTAMELAPDSQKQTLQEKTLTASIITTHKQAFLNQVSIQKTIVGLRDDELLFGLKTLYHQLRGEA